MVICLSKHQLHVYLKLTCNTDIKIVIEFTANVLDQICSIVETSIFLHPIFPNRICKRQLGSNQVHSTEHPKQGLNVLAVCV